MAADDIHHYRVGGIGTPLGKRWYATGSMGVQGFQCGLSSLSAANYLYATPFFTGRGHTLDSVGVYCQSVGTSSKVRLGFYNANQSVTDLYPTSLHLDLGELNVAVGFLSFTGMTHSFLADKLYWAVVITDGTGLFTASGPTASPSVLGWGNSFGQPYGNPTGLSVARTYGVLPATFPTGAVSSASAMLQWHYYSDALPLATHAKSVVSTLGIAKATHHEKAVGTVSTVGTAKAHLATGVVSTVGTAVATIV